MVEKKTIVVVLVVIIGVMAVAQYMLQGDRGGPERNATVILLSAIEKAADINTYTMESSLSIDGAEPIYSKKVVSGHRARVDGEGFYVVDAPTDG